MIKFSDSSVNFMLQNLNDIPSLNTLLEKAITFEYDSKSFYYYDGNNWIKICSAEEIIDKLKTVDGSGSGLDADLLDGLESTKFFRLDLDNIHVGDIRANQNNKYNLGSSNYWYANVYSVNFVGSLKGNADTATNAIKLGNVFSSNYIRNDVDTITADVHTLNLNNILTTNTDPAVAGQVWCDSGNGYVLKVSQG